MDWVADSPADRTNELNVALGIANYGTTDVFYAGADGGLLMTPWDLTPVPAAPTSSLNATTVVPAQAAGVGYVGVCEVGGAQPDVIVFYVEGDPTVAANLTTLYWRQISEDWSAQPEHSVAMSGDFLFGSTWDKVPGATGAWFLHGRVVALNNAFAFVSMNSSEVDVYVSNLLAPGTPDAVGRTTAWTPTTASGQMVRDLDAIPFTYRNSVYLALGSLYGTPTTNSDWHWGSIIKQWTGMQAAVRVCSVGDDGSCTVTTSTSFPVTADPDPGPSTDDSGLKMQSGALNIRLVRGGVYGTGPRRRAHRDDTHVRHPRSHAPQRQHPRRHQPLRHRPAGTPRRLRGHGRPLLADAPDLVRDSSSAVQRVAAPRAHERRLQRPGDDQDGLPAESTPRASCRATSSSRRSSWPTPTARRFPRASRPRRRRRLRPRHRPRRHRRRWCTAPAGSASSGRRPRRCRPRASTSRTSTT